MSVITQVRLDLGCLQPTSVSKLTTGKDDFATYAAQDMALVHNTLVRCWNSIYKQAPHVVEKDYPDFIVYALTWHRIVEIHHDGEEQDLYPKMEKFMAKPGFFSAAVDEHKAFHDGLDRYKAYLVESKAKPSEFSGKKLVEIMDSFGEALFTHLNAEPTLLLTIQGFDDVALRKIWDDHVKMVLGGASPITEIPIVWVNCDSTFEDGKWAHFPPMPAPVKFVMRHVAARWHNQYWRFGSTTYGGQPQVPLALREGYGK
ncbi:MAG: hypothetical protein GOMPHAMPRED_000917 [Gomphillus americanus]|uniref:Hemerythrin-like domain-containing protein n=1 Tax=Gomphillus americanus TaxID=1940652 RepID=A0A8H3F0W5_9LECA|nr:MAG: hypothetical protein GOMPHAMPRED_000917 [Gomphillus americanus]